MKNSCHPTLLPSFPMKTLSLTTRSLRPTAANRTGANRLVSWHAVSGLVVLPLAAWWFTRGAPGWVVMWAVAGAEFGALKLLTLTGLWRTAPAWRVGAYLALWPGMNAGTFLAPNVRGAPVPNRAELTFAVAKLAGGLVACAWAVRNVDAAPMMVVGWVGMLGIIFTLHFGALHVVSWIWRRAGMAAPPLMRAPIAATSLADFWGVRWNVAFAECGRRYVLRPLARHWGTRVAGGVVFLVSGLVHESVVSVPAGGGWGGPTLYFGLQGAGAWFEKTAAGRRLGLAAGWRGWTWTVLITAVPLPFLFHEPFVGHVIVPLFRFIAASLL